jgi:hypothetical protein
MFDRPITAHNAEEGHAFLSDDEDFASLYVEAEAFD